jgi:hypothetical protein
MIAMTTNRSTSVKPAMDFRLYFFTAIGLLKAPQNSAESYTRPIGQATALGTVIAQMCLVNDAKICRLIPDIRSKSSQ